MPGPVGAQGVGAARLGLEYAEGEAEAAPLKEVVDEAEGLGALGAGEEGGDTGTRGSALGGVVGVWAGRVGLFVDRPEDLVAQTGAQIGKNTTAFKCARHCLR